MNNSEDKRDDWEQLVDLQNAARRCSEEIIGTVLPHMDMKVNPAGFHASYIITKVAKFLYEYYGRPMIELPLENRDDIKREHQGHLIYFLDGDLKQEPETVTGTEDTNKP